ncbi:MAG: hypothetical protein AAFV07_07050 [Bacteroidota bacterium]
MMFKTVNLSALLLVVLVMIAPMGGFAQQAQVELISNPIAPIYNLSYQNADAERLVLEITDSYGRSIHRKVVKNRTQFLQELNFSRMDAGTYGVSLRGKTVDFYKVIAVPGPELVEGFVVDWIKSPDSKKVQMRVDGLDETTVRVTFADVNGSVIFDEMVALDAGNSRVFNLEQLRTNEVIANVASADQIESTSLRIR